MQVPVVRRRVQFVSRVDLGLKIVQGDVRPLCLAHHVRLPLLTHEVVVGWNRLLRWLLNRFQLVCARRVLGLRHLGLLQQHRLQVVQLSGLLRLHIVGVNVARLVVLLIQDAAGCVTALLKLLLILQ